MRLRSYESGRPRARGGYTFLEVSVAFALLGIGLGGLCPLVIMQIRLSRKVQQGFNPQTAYFRPGTTSYLVPQADAWERKLGIAASIRAEAETVTVPPSPPSTPPYEVTIVAPVEKGLDTEEVTVRVSVKKISSSGGGATP